jgi:DNA ligase (NAD+)
MLIDEIALRKSVCMSDFISALGIPNVGRQTAEVLANHFSGNVHRLVECLTDTGASLKIDSIGDVTMMCLRQYVINCRDVINTLLDYVLIIPDKTNTSAQTVVFTGKFTNLSRKEIEQVARHLGFKTNDTVTKDTTYLIVGENPGEKVDRARKLGVPVLSETQWAVLVGQYTSEFNNT